MQLFLASSLVHSFDAIKDRLPAGGRVLFIPNAADPFGGHQMEWVADDRDIFIKNGYDIDECDIRNTSLEIFAGRLKTSAIVHVCGGSTLYVHDLLSKQGLSEVLKKSVLSGEIVYTGTSAGSMITAPSLALCAYDPDEMEFMYEGMNFSGLNLAPVLIAPHANNEDFKPSNHAMIEHLPEGETPVMMLYDTQVLVVTDGTMEILSV